MKRIAAIVLVLIVTSTIFASFVFRQYDIITDIAGAIKNGNSADVAKYFNTTIDLTVPDNEGTYSKTQAELILKDFFSKNPPSAFTVNHNGSSNDGSLYAIGTYTADSGSYRTYFLLKKSGSGYLIQKLEFESE
ncbi:MAG: DUF4783 domain-containing protein [Bacteroidota bacterium]